MLSIYNYINLDIYKYICVHITSQDPPCEGSPCAGQGPPGEGPTSQEPPGEAPETKYF